MKTILLVILLFISVKLLAPEVRCFYIEKAKAIGRFDRLIAAVVWIESRNNPLAYNPREGAVGAFQIRQCRIEHYNRLTGSNYKLTDCYDYELSRKIFVFFAERIGDESKIIKSWNGSGPKTIEYYLKVKKVLLSL